MWHAWPREGGLHGFQCQRQVFVVVGDGTLGGAEHVVGGEVCADELDVFTCAPGDFEETQRLLVGREECDGGAVLG